MEVEQRCRVDPGPWEMLAPPIQELDVRGWEKRLRRQGRETNETEE